MFCDALSVAHRHHDLERISKRGFEIKEFSERGSLKTILLAVCTRVLIRVEAFM